MNKEQRMKNTDYYEYTNVNPKNKYVGDCVIRAIALACNQTWEQTVREMTELGIKKGLVLNDEKLYPLYLEQKGFHQEKEPRDMDNCKITISEWIDKKCSVWNIYVINVGSHHVTCVNNKKVRDTWNCATKIIHKFWWRRKDLFEK